MAIINENQFLMVVKQVFNKAKKKFLKEDKILELLAKEGLTPEEAKQAISLAKRKKEIQVCFPYVDDIRGELSYMLLTDEDRRVEKEMDEELIKRPRHKGKQ